MHESFPQAPGHSDGSFPQNDETLANTSLLREPEPPGPLLFKRYRVERELGRGGMGVVYLAHDTTLGVRVAIKLLPELLAQDAEAMADLRKEVLRGMALTHAAIVRTYTFERDASGAGIVMEYVEGETLKDLKLRQPDYCFDPETLLPWLEQLVSPLDYAHREAHIVHRDLKPQNIMLTPAGRIKIADFGVAATLGDTLARHSMEGKIAGTLAYMSPQQAQGQRPTHLDDIHALGATLYDLLTGKPPFFRGGLTEVGMQVINLVPPSLAERREELGVTGRREIPAIWEKTIRACLAKDSADRPQSAGEVYALLSGMQARSGVEPEKPCRGVPWFVWVGGAALLVGAAAFALTRPRGAPHPTAAVQPAVSAQPTATLRGATSTPALTPRLIHPGEATGSTPYINTLGQPFVPAGTGGVLFCIWETRVQDFSEFFTHSNYDMEKGGDKPFTLTPDGFKQIGGNWRRPYFKPTQSDRNPVVCVSWMDADAFCIWLTKRERSAGRITADQRYRLPGDAEWSVAAGLHDRETRAGTPASKDGKIPGLYSWGTAWPPPARSGNIAGQEAELRDAHAGSADTYSDGYRHTSPVGSFAPNAFGLYDMDGNVHEWCADFYSPGDPKRVLRGPSWYSHRREALLITNRYPQLPGARQSTYGFRVVLTLNGR